MAKPPCFILSTTDKYASSNFTYFPTIAIFTASPFIFFIFLIKLSQSLLLGSILSKCKCLQTCTASPFFSKIKGTSYSIFALLFSITFSGLTLQNIAIFSFIEFGIGSSVLHTNISGFIPIDCNSFTECCVGFDFSSFVPNM